MGGDGNHRWRMEQMPVMWEVRSRCFIGRGSVCSRVGF